MRNQLQPGQPAAFQSPHQREIALRRFAATVLFVGLALALTLSSRPRRTTLSLITPAARVPLPPLSLSLLSGKFWRLQDHRGHIVLLNLWATWCGPCRQEMPLLSTLAQQQPVDILGIALDTRNPRQAVQSFLAQTPVAYPIALPEPGSPLGLPPEALPITLLIDRHGRVAQRLTGAFTQPQIEHALTQLLAEP